MQLLIQHLLTWLWHLDFKLERGIGRWFSTMLFLLLFLLLTCSNWSQLCMTELNTVSFTVSVQDSINSYLLFCFSVFTSLRALECIQFVLSLLPLYPQQLAFCLAHFEHFFLLKET